MTFARTLALSAIILLVAVAIVASPVCVPKTLSTLMRWQNCLSWRNDWIAVFIPCSRDRAMQVDRLSWRNDWIAVFIPCSRDRAMQVEEPA